MEQNEKTVLDSKAKNIYRILLVIIIFIVFNFLLFFLPALYLIDPIRLFWKDNFKEFIISSLGIALVSAIIPASLFLKIIKKKKLKIILINIYYIIYLLFVYLLLEYITRFD